MKKLIISCVLFGLCSVLLQAQNSNTKQADNYYKKLHFIDAIKAYNKVVDDRKDDDYVHLQLATSYRLTSNSVEAEKWYAQIVKKNKDPENYFWYAQMLAANRKYKEYKVAMQNFSSLKPADSRAISFQKVPDLLEEIDKKEPGFSIKNATLNSKYSDLGAVPFENRIYFASARDTSGKIYPWNEEPTLDIFSAVVANDGFTDIKAVTGLLNTKFNEGTLTISKDGKKMYFTRTNFLNGKYNKDAKGVSNLKIFSADLHGNNWENIQELPFNSNDYSCGHPSLSADGKILYFSSNMPGGYGGTDLYKVAIGSTFGKPENLGATINSPGDEQFPFVDGDETLYFSSNGHVGLGGLDIFYVTLNNNVAQVTNIGRPLNSSHDDFSFTINTITGQGFITSNREGGNGSDDIYAISTIAVKQQPNSQNEEQPIIKQPKEEDAVAFRPIYFEFGKVDITANSAAEIDKVITAMKKDPKIKIMVNTYADSNGSEAFNAKLTEKRATAIIDYILSNTISKERLFYRGYGKSNQAIDCSPCTAEQDARNRRAEFIIINR